MPANGRYWAGLAWLSQAQEQRPKHLSHLPRSARHINKELGPNGAHEMCTTAQAPGLTLYKSSNPDEAREHANEEQMYPVGVPPLAKQPTSLAGRPALMFGFTS